PRDPGLDLAAASAPSRCAALRRNSVAQRQRGQGHKQTATAALLSSATGRRTPATGIVRNTLALERDADIPTIPGRGGILASPAVPRPRRAPPRAQRADGNDAEA